MSREHVRRTQELRRSGAHGTMKDKRTKRKRTRATQKEEELRREDG